MNTVFNERKSGAAIEYVLIGLNAAIGVGFTPFILSHLGAAEYGLYQLIGAFVGYLAILDFGIAATITRYVAKYQVENNQEREENFLAMCLVVYTVIAFLVFVVGMIGYWNLGTIFANSLTSSELDQAKIMFVILLVNIIVILFDRAFIGAISGHERFVFPRLVNVGRILFRVVVLVLLLISGYGAVSIVTTDAVFNLSVLIINATYAKRHVGISIHLKNWDKALFREIYTFSFYIFLSAITLQLWFRLPQVILGVMKSTISVANFALAVQLCQIYSSLSSGISGVFLPKATQLVDRCASGAELTDMMIAPSRYQLMLLGIVISGFLLFGRQFIRLWVGIEFSPVYSMAAVIMVPMTIPLFQNVVVSILQAKNKISFRAILYLSIAVCGAIAAVPLINKFGTIGAALGPALTFSVGSIIVMNIYYNKIIKIQIVRFFRETCRGIFPSIILSSLLGIIIVNISGQSWLIFTFKVLLYSTIYSATMWKLGLNWSEKLFFRSCTALIISTSSKLVGMVKHK